jgi:hypothetical protein
VSFLFADARIIDIILVITACEAVAISTYYRLTGRGLSAANLLPTLLAGFFLVVALRLVLSAAWPGWIAVSLTIALIAHIVDLTRRWR